MPNTFVIAISLLGIVAVGETATAVWTLSRKQNQALQDEAAAGTRDGSDATLNTADAPFVPNDQEQLAMGILPKPTPIPQAKDETNIEARVNELVEQARILRDRGDTSTALVRLREGLAIVPSSPMLLSELAITLEKMGLTDKALEQWRHIFEMGEAAGIYYAAADAKIKNLDVQARPAPTAAAPSPAGKEEAGIQPGSTLGLVELSLEDQNDPASSKKFTLKIPVKARPDAKVDPHDVAIQVYFYDMVGGKSVVRTNANIKSWWNTPPLDWVHGDIEVLEVEYQQPKPKGKSPEERNFYGYIVRVYYKGELQDMRADPVKLLKEYPPPVNLDADSANEDPSR